MGTLRVLGCDGSYPGPGGAASGYLLEAGSTKVWLDAGSGTFANLQRWCDPRDLSAIVLSHEHPDHWRDIEGFAMAARHRGVPTGVPVYAPAGLRERSSLEASPAFVWRDVVPSDRIVVGDLVASFVATDHGPPTLAVRFDVDSPGSVGQPGAAFAYSADSGPDWSVEELGVGLGTVLCEATYTKEHEGALRHLSGRQAGVMASSARVQRLIVTHRWPTVSAEAVAHESAEAFGGAVDQARIGALFTW
jgi:ribonuclease BN (tRNA processing enzyme)